MIAKGSFEISSEHEPPYDTVDGVTLGRTTFDKRFFGPLEATSKVQMLGARTPVAGSAGYVAIERIAGVLEGKTGTFVVVHSGLMSRGSRTGLSITIVPDSGTGQLAGISGRMDIQIVDGKHFYELDYTLEA